MTISTTSVRVFDGTHGQLFKNGQIVTDIRNIHCEKFKTIRSDPGMPPVSTFPSGVNVSFDCVGSEDALATSLLNEKMQDTCRVQLYTIKAVGRCLITGEAKTVEIQEIDLKSTHHGVGTTII